VCGRDLEYKRDTHESSLGYREPVDEIWQCSKCQTEFRIARKPIIIEELERENVEPKKLIDSELKENMSLLLETDDLEVWLYNEIFESNDKKYQLAEVFRFENNNYNNCRMEIHLLPLQASDKLLYMAKQVVGLENDLENETIRKDKENLFRLLIDTNYSYLYFKESDLDMEDSFEVRKDKMYYRFEEVIKKLKNKNKNLELYFKNIIDQNSL
jgi:hypothetical protein